MEMMTSGLEVVLIVVVVGAAALGAAIKIVLIEYHGVKEVWNQVLGDEEKKQTPNSK